MLRLWPHDVPVRVEMNGIVLREWRSSDVDTMVELFDTDFMDRWTPLPHPFTADVALKYVERARRARRASGAVQLAITQGSDVPVGEVLAFEGDHAGDLELAYAVGEKHSGQHLAARAVAAMVSVARSTELRSAFLHIAVDNPGSESVARSNGFERTSEPVVVKRRKGYTLELATWRLTF